MLGDLDASIDVKTVVIEKLDRLARDVIVQENIIRHLQSRGIDILSSSPAEVGLCDEDPTRKFIRVVMGASAQLEKDLIILRTRVARERIRNRGEKCEGRKAYGENGDLTEVRVLGLMQKLQEQGNSARAIAKALNEWGEKTRSGKRWHAGTVSKILKREKSNGRA